jgi:hypothetical protein
LDPVCDWKCSKPTNCPKPKCTLVCENPNCNPQIKTKCCDCEGQMGQFMNFVFKETEKNPACC